MSGTHAYQHIPELAREMNRTNCRWQPTVMMFMRLLFAVILPACVSSLAWCQEISAEAGPEVLFGESPRLVVRGLKPREIATIHGWL